MTDLIYLTPKNSADIKTTNTANFGIDAVTKNRLSLEATIQNSTTNNSTQNLKNDIKNNITLDQKSLNTLSVSLTNQLLFKNIICTTINISNVKQTNISDLQQSTTILTQARTVIKNTIMNSIKTTMEQKLDGLTDIVNKISKQQAANISKLQDTTIDPNGVAQAVRTLMGRTAAGGYGGRGAVNTTNLDFKIGNENDVKSLIGLNNTQINTILNTVNNEISNLIENKIKNDVNTFISMENVMEFNKIACGTLNINNINQSNALVAKIKTIIDNKIDNEVITNIINNIKSRFSQMFTKVAENYNDESAKAPSELSKLIGRYNNNLNLLQGAELATYRVLYDGDTDTTDEIDKRLDMLSNTIDPTKRYPLPPGYIDYPDLEFTPPPPDTSNWFNFSTTKVFDSKTFSMILFLIILIILFIILAGLGGFIYFNIYKN